MRRIEAALLAIAALCIVLLGVVITANVVGRQFFGAGVPDAIVLVRELMVGVVVLPLAYVTAERAHISVEFVFNMVGPRAKRAMTAFASLFAALSVPFILWAAWRELAHTWTGGGYFFGDLGLPEWPGRLLFFLGMLVFQLRLVHLAVLDLSAAFSREPLDRQKA